MAAPITDHGWLVATLLCGEFFADRPTEQDFQRCVQRLQALGIHLDPRHLRRAYFQTAFVSPTKVQAAGQMLGDLAQYLSLMAAHCLLRRQAKDPECVVCAKKLVAKHFHELPSTRKAARAAHVTEPYFCRKFKAALGMTFSEYVARCHVERARELLRDANLRITDIASDAGFQSIPHFNHTFKRYTGLSPSAYRASLAAKPT